MLEALGNIGDFIGGIGVVITLAYLAVQIRHNTRAGCEDSKHLELQERTQFNTYLLQVFNTFESLFFQAQQGSVDQAFFNSKVDITRVALGPPGVRSWWDSVGSQMFDGRFRQFVASELLS